MTLMHFGESEIHEIVCGVWQLMLGQDIGLAPPAEAIHEQAHLSAGIVQIAGAWEGAVACSASGELLRQAASVLYDTQPDELSVEAIQDVLAEFTNMIGGNLKALLPGPNYLCLPAVFEGADIFQRLSPLKPALRASFRADGQPFIVDVLLPEDHPGDD